MFYIICILLIILFWGGAFLIDRFNYNMIKNRAKDEAWKEYQDMCFDMCKDCYYKKRCQELENDDVLPPT